MKDGLKILGLLSAMLITGNVWAQDGTQASDVQHALPGKPWYVSGMFSYVDSDSDRGSKGGLGGIVSVGKKMTWGLTLELTGFYSTASAKHSGGSADLQGYGASALFFPSQTIPNAYGIVAVMAGHTKNLPGPRSSYQSTVFDVGLGYLQPITSHLLIRAEARYRTDDQGRTPTGATATTNSFAEGVYSVGLLVPFGLPKPPPEAAEEPDTSVVDTQSLDDDNDGVSNDNDQCPASPAGPVDDNGCPVSDNASSDADTTVSDDAGTDGSMNGSDSGNSDCRTPAAGEQVDENGCAVDSATSTP